MQNENGKRKKILVVMVIILLLFSTANAVNVVVDFDSATTLDKYGNPVPGGYFDLYEEDGFRLFATSNGGDTQWGQVRISDGFTTSLAAFPEFGFDDQDILASTISGNSFGFLSLDIYEYSLSHPVSILLVEGIRAGSVVASQMFTTDGVAGLQTFSLTGFTNLDKVRLGGTGSSTLVGVDNLTFDEIPEPLTIIFLILGTAGIRRRFI